MLFHLPAALADADRVALDFLQSRGALLEQRDPALWTDDASVAARINDRLGWLDGPRWGRQQIDRLHGFAADVAAGGTTDVVLLGMGGSSLAPEVCAAAFGSQPDRAQLHVLDNTHPDAIRAVESRIDPDHTMFIVASKSGSTIETRCFARYFLDRMRERHGDAAGSRFVAITDDGSDLLAEARELKFANIFINPSDIGGRYSALSFFGLVPAAAIGLDIDAMIATGEREMKACSTDPHSSAAHLGALLGVLAGQGRNKLTLLAGDVMSPLGVWIEQLVAESTGKEGKGILPITGEARQAIPVYSSDRVFTVTRTPDDSALEAMAKALVDAGHPVIEWTVSDAADLGQEFYRWEVATSFAGAVMGINPFDEPNVTESKNKTGELLQRVLAGESIDSETPSGNAGDLPVWGTDQPVAEQLAAWASPGDYLAILAYGLVNDEIMVALERLRHRCGEHLGIPVTLGIGPRFLHSTGQLHKGGDASGIFLQITSDAATGLEIPDEAFDFAQLNSCQALGDLEVLRARGRRAIRVHAADSLTRAASIL